MYRKWDNVKHISEKIKEKRVPERLMILGYGDLRLIRKRTLAEKKRFSSVWCGCNVKRDEWSKSYRRFCEDVSCKRLAGSET